MITISKIYAEDLVGILSLFEDPDEERKFIENAEENNLTYEISIETVNGSSNNTVWENQWNSSNDIFYDVYVDELDIKFLSEVGEIEIDWEDEYENYKFITELAENYNVKVWR